jgi:hypothetical protein
VIGVLLVIILVVWACTRSGSPAGAPAAGTASPKAAASPTAPPSRAVPVAGGCVPVSDFLVSGIMTGANSASWDRTVTAAQAYRSDRDGVYFVALRLQDPATVHPQPDQIGVWALHSLTADGRSPLSVGPQARRLTQWQHLDVDQGDPGPSAALACIA